MANTIRTFIRIYVICILIIFMASCANDRVRYSLAASHPSSDEIVTIQTTPTNQYFSNERNQSFREFFRISLLSIDIDSGITSGHLERIFEENSLKCIRQGDQFICERSLYARLACCSGRNLYRNVIIFIRFNNRSGFWFLDSVNGRFL
jgi:hypothetical protein